jgi:hypothetical protein
MKRLTLLGPFIPKPGLGSALVAGMRAYHPIRWHFI